MGALLVVVNVAAGKARRPLTARIREKVGARGTVLETDSLEALDAAVAAHANAEDVVIWGGDGTITETVSAFARHAEVLPRFTLLPAGTMNANARGLGFKGGPWPNLLRFLDGRLQTVERTLVEADGRAGFLFGIGLIPNYLAVYEEAERGGMRSAFRALGISAMSLFSGVEEDKFFRGFEARVTADGASFVAGRYTNLSAGGTEFLPMGFKHYHRAAEAPGRFHFVAHRLSARRAAKELWPIRSGRGMQDCEQALFARVRIELDAPEVYTFDGELYAPVQNIELTGRRIRLTAP
ncbi:MAG: diacylglycerol kinase family protein [Deltaproteobacteria bacterium]